MKALDSCFHGAFCCFVVEEEKWLRFTSSSFKSNLAVTDCSKSKV
jgi:hypothetical protein